MIGISSIARLDEADTLVTDAGLDPAARSIAAEQVRELLIAASPDRAFDDDDGPDRATGSPTEAGVAVESTR